MAQFQFYMSKIKNITYPDLDSVNHNLTVITFGFQEQQMELN